MNFWFSSLHNSTQPKFLTRPPSLGELGYDKEPDRSLLVEAEFQWDAVFVAQRSLDAHRLSPRSAFLLADPKANGGHRREEESRVDQI